ncbi:hypothetical protein JL722_2721 [Aureococcus anophagefferens]|nr:hypothetical protein JL722_2721 [Aureococcus anophagefferens]
MSKRARSASPDAPAVPGDDAECAARTVYCEGLAYECSEEEPAVEVDGRAVACDYDDRGAPGVLQLAPACPGRRPRPAKKARTAP